MGYSLTTSLARPRVRSSASPKTHVPGSRLQERGHRFYQPEIGRWLSRDPIEEMGGQNLVGFVNNQPVSRIDHLGLSTGEITVYIYLENDRYLPLPTAGIAFAVGWKPPTGGDWDRPVGCKPCKLVKPLQTVTMSAKWLFGSYSYGPVEEYGADDPGTDGSTDWWVDGETTKAGLSDMPQVPIFALGVVLVPGGAVAAFGGLQKWDFRAETSFKCLEGPDAGSVYGKVIWGGYWRLLGDSDARTHLSPYPATLQ